MRLALKKLSFYIFLGLLAGGILSAGLQYSFAQYRAISLDHEARVAEPVTIASGQAAGRGFMPGQEIELSLFTADRQTVQTRAFAEDDGTFRLTGIDLNGRDLSHLSVYFRAYQDPSRAPLEVTVNINRGLRTVDVSGHRVQSGSDIGLWLDADGNTESTNADWAGSFDFLPMGNASIADGTGQICVNLEQNNEPAMFCFALETGQSSLMTPAQLGTGGGMGPMSPYSTWGRPSQCQPAGTLISVCDAGHMAGFFSKEIQNIIVAFMEMTEQFTVVMLHQVEIVGTFLDAKQQLEVQRWFQEKHGDAHRDYHPSKQMCYFATFSKELNAAQRKTDLSVRTINEYMLDRDQGPARERGAGDFQGTAAPEGPAQDMKTRLEQFSTLYCNVNHNRQDGLSYMCAGGDPTRRDKDIDFRRTIDSNLTLNLDFSDGAASADETDVLNLSKYLFSHEILPRPEREDLYDDIANVVRFQGINAIQDARSIFAMRGVARNSYGHLVGMRSAGSGLTGGFMNTLMREMAIPDNEILNILGADPAASMGDKLSYFAQMEVLTKKMYQNPNFYTNLYDKPANVERMGATLQAIQLMHDREKFEASLRREMLISILLEARLRKHQDDLDREIQGTIDLNYVP